MAKLLFYLLVSLLGYGSTYSELVGGKHRLSQDDIQDIPEFKNALPEIENRFNKMHNSMNYYKMYEPSGVTSQVVQGTLFEFTAHFGRTNCRNNPGTTGFVASACDFTCTSGGCTNDLEKCHVSIWSRPWLKEKHEKQKIELKGCRKGIK